MKLKPFETVKRCNAMGLMNTLRLDQFNPDDFTDMDAPEFMPSGSVEAWPGCAAFPMSQGCVERESK